jgi:eukaryotic-like serine/threonine-protein kinase
VARLSAIHGGEVIAGKYRVDRVLGKGAMGLVLAATHMHLRQQVAIKVLHTTSSQATVARFLREARAAVRLTSRHAARVLDVGELHDGAPYMVMEYLDGSDLEAFVRQRGPLPVEDAVRYVLEAIEALAEAHAIGIVHRDLKPANLFLARTADGMSSVKVLDFGISKTSDGQLEGDGLQLTQTTDLLGSPLYMSPEQLQSARSATVQSDIWALGAILYQFLAGRVPFDTTSFPELVLMVNMQSPPPLEALRRDVPPALAEAIGRCLAKKPADRFVSVGELSLCIAPYGPPEAQTSAERACRTLEAAGISVRRTLSPPRDAAPSLTRASSPGITESARPPPGPAVDARSLVASTRPPRAGGLWRLVWVLVLLLFTAAGAYLVMRRPQFDKPPASPPVETASLLPVETASPLPVQTASPTVSPAPPPVVPSAPSALPVDAGAPVSVPTPRPTGATTWPAPPKASATTPMASSPEPTATTKRSGLPVLDRK